MEHMFKETYRVNYSTNNDSVMLNYFTSKKPDTMC